MAKTNLQKWIACLRKNEPGAVSHCGGLPEISESDRGKVLVVDSNGSPAWGTVAGGGIPLGADESIGIFKD